MRKNLEAWKEAFKFWQMKSGTKINSMKTICIIMTFLAFGCAVTPQKDIIRAFMPGVYVKHIDGLYSIGEDSLTISHFNGQTYTILHNTSYRRIINKTIQPVKYQSERWTALYDEQSKVLNEQKDGKVLSFLPRENKLLLGSGEYKKVK